MSNEAILYGKAVLGIALLWMALFIFMAGGGYRINNLKPQFKKIAVTILSLIAIASLVGGITVLSATLIEIKNTAGLLNIPGLKGFSFFLAGPLIIILLAISIWIEPKKIIIWIGLPAAFGWTLYSYYFLGVFLWSLF